MSLIRIGWSFGWGCSTYNKNCFQRLTLESWYTNLEQTPLSICQQQPAPYKRLNPRRKRNRQTDQKPTNLFNNRWIETHQWLMTNFTRVFQSSRLNWQITFNGLTDESRSTDQTYNIIDWQTLFNWLWRLLPLRLTKGQAPTTVLFRTTLTTLYRALFKHKFVGKIDIRKIGAATSCEIS